MRADAIETLLQDLRHEFSYVAEGSQFHGCSSDDRGAWNRGEHSDLQCVEPCSVPSAAPESTWPYRSVAGVPSTPDSCNRSDVSRCARVQSCAFSRRSLSHFFAKLKRHAARRAPGPEQIDTAFVSQDFLPLLAVTPFLGTGFTAEQFRKNAGGVVILSYELWQHHFGSDREIVGKIESSLFVTRERERGWSIPLQIVGSDHSC
jgi:hypothetical protein